MLGRFATLYEQILRLPSANPPDPELPERILYEKWQGVRERIAQRTGYDLYRVVFETSQKTIVGCKNGQVAGVEVARTGLVQLDRGAHLWE